MASAGAQVGLVGVGGVGGDVGVVLRGRQTRKPSRPHRVRAYADAAGFLGPVGGKAYVSRDRVLRGYEYNIGPAARRSPVHGDRIDVPIIPGVIAISASRKGGLGLQLIGIPLPVVPYPFVFGTAQLYVSHPALSGVSTKILDKADAIGRKLRPILDWTVNRWQRVRTRFGRSSASTDSGSDEKSRDRKAASVQAERLAGTRDTQRNRERP